MNDTPSPDTKQKILDTSEKLFATQGYSVTSLRSITSEAGVNLASINYHFKSKEGLLMAVLRRRIDPMNRERLAMLDALETAGNHGVEPTIRAMLEPAFRMKERDGEYSIRILGKLQESYKSRFMVKIGDHIRSIAVENILLFFADGRVVYVLTDQGREYIVDFKMEELDEVLDPEVFFRISRSYSVNINAIRDVIIHSNSRLKILLNREFEREMIVSREKVNPFKMWFGMR